MSESRKGKRNPYPAGTLSWTSDPEKISKPCGISSEITLDLVARTAFELKRIFPGEVRIDGDSLRMRGQEAIELLSIWALQLETERRIGAAAKKAEEVVNSWQCQDEEQRRRLEQLKLEASQRADRAKIPRTPQIPFAKAARQIFPGKREPAKLLEEILKTLIEEKSPLSEPIIDSCRKALRYKSVPEGLIPELKTIGDAILKRYKSRIATVAGRMGGFQRAQKHSRNKTAVKHDEK